jgi:hypothetical protein
MTTFPCLVRAASPSGEDRYSLGHPLVDLYLEIVSHVEVIEGDGVRVVPQGCGGIAVTETCLGFEQFALFDEVGRYRVAETMQRRILDPGGPTKAGGTCGSARRLSCKSPGSGSGRRVSRPPGPARVRPMSRNVRG